MAGFVGGNLMRSDVDLWYAEDWPELPAGVVLLDVRSPAEHAEWSIPGSLLIPHKQLRERLDEIPRGATVYTYCRSGFRSYLAQRILVQNGWTDAKTLAGGELTFRAVHPDGSSGWAQYPVVSYAEEELAARRPAHTR